MEQKIKLKPCPFCGSKKIKLWFNYFGEVGGECEICGARSGHDYEGETKEQTAEAWNRRADNG